MGDLGCAVEGVKKIGANTPTLADKLKFNEWSTGIERANVSKIKGARFG